MGQRVRLTSRRDGFSFEAYRAPPEDALRGGLVLLHAIWGVTPHLRALADDFAAQGYDVLVPSLFDRWSAGFPESDRDPGRFKRQMQLAETARWGAEVIDAVEAAIDALPRPVFAAGFCFGGTTAWLAAARCDGLAAAACFYGGHIADYLGETPRCPVVLHFGKTDPLIPMADVARIIERHPEMPLWLYDAGHAFVAPGEDHVEDAARLALLRARQFFQLQGGKGEMGG